MSAKKKAAKKKGAKKKSAKKKGATKKAARSSPSVPTKVRALVGAPGVFWELPTNVMRAVFPLGSASMVVVCFDDTGGTNRPRASRGRRDVVWFANHGRVNRVLTPDKWVFTGTAAPIRVDKGKSVGPFVLDPASNYVGPVTCTGDPSFSGGGPGDPQFDADN